MQKRLIEQRQDGIPHSGHQSRSSRLRKRDYRDWKFIVAIEQLSLNLSSVMSGFSPTNITHLGQFSQHVVLCAVNDASFKWPAKFLS
jgi:hypothetical protein